MMLYFEDGTKEMILNPEIDFQRVIEEKLGKESAELYEEIVEDAKCEGFSAAERFLGEIQNDLRMVIQVLQKDNESPLTICNLEDIYNKIDEFDPWDYKN